MREAKIILSSSPPSNEGGANMMLTDSLYSTNSFPATLRGQASA